MSKSKGTTPYFTVSINRDLADKVLAKLPFDKKPSGRPKYSSLAALVTLLLENYLTAKEVKVRA